jgi:hypothetical protein
MFQQFPTSMEVLSGGRPIGLKQALRVGLTAPLRYNHGTMDVLPAHRRPGFIATIAIIIASSIYYLMLRTSGTALTPRTFGKDLILILGLIATLGLITFLIYLLVWIGDTSRMLTAFLRVLILMVFAGFNILVLSGASSPTLRTVLTHLDLALITLLMVITLTAQFVLPVRSGKERLAVIRRLLGFLIGERGPSTFIRNGSAREKHGERLRRALGVFLIDQASSAVLRTDTQFTRAVGPGVHFTERGEWRAESLDLRRQIHTIQSTTPLAGEPIELDEINAFALTHDGIPVSTDLSVEFMLDPGHTYEPREGRYANKPPYEYNPQAAERAVYGHAYGKFEELPWTALPLRLVVDLWRELVKGKDLKELLGDDEHEKPTLQQMRREIQARLTTPPPDGSSDPLANREFSILHSRGIRVLKVDGMSSLHLPDDVRLERMAIWREDWADAVQEAVANANQGVKRARREGEAKACKILISELTAELRHELTERKIPGRRDTIRLILEDAKNLCSQQGLVADGANLVMQLSDMISELRGLDEDCAELGGGDLR